MRKEGHRVIRIGGASGYWGDALLATPQLLAEKHLDYIIYDYLAEITMSILARARAKDDAAGYAADFVTQTLRHNLHEIARRGVKIIANAGGVNVRACAMAARALVRELGLDLRVGFVEGDNLLHLAQAFSRDGVREMFSGAPFPDAASIGSINAYIGAFEIAEALGRGADIVITGRCVDSALTLGACIHEFGWRRDEWNKLAGGSLAGHIIECGVQTTGGNFTDWEDVAEQMHCLGYPIAEVDPSGEFVCTKPSATGGVVSVGSVSEQMLYEIADPQSYLLPDVTCDFSQVTISQLERDRVRVAGARGRPPPSALKVCATYEAGYRGGRLLNFYGRGSARKGASFAAAGLARARAALRQRNLEDFTETDVEVLGAEHQFGAFSKGADAREVVVKIAFRHPQREGIEIALRELTGLGLAAPPGASGFQAGRPGASPVLRLYSFLLDRRRVALSIDVEGERVEVETFTQPAPQAAPPLAPLPCATPDASDAIYTPLWAIAWARSGDKGNTANVGVIAREAAFLPYISACLTPEAVQKRFAHFVEGAVERYELPGVRAINFVLHDALGGGGVVSLRSDPQGKGYAQLLLEHPVPLPRALAARHDLPMVELE
ncbi:MAG: DUF1446 domain-containing protein [Hyphomonadaceae bacterium]|nr:DUF1446 domain-containing protein [Hyphomonadaceae bacterium]